MSELDDTGDPICMVTDARLHEHVILGLFMYYILRGLQMMSGPTPRGDDSLIRNMMTLSQPTLKVDSSLLHFCFIVFNILFQSTQHPMIPLHLLPSYSF